MTVAMARQKQINYYNMAIKQRTKSLSAKGSDLSDTKIQLKVLNQAEVAGIQIPKFGNQLKTYGQHPYVASEVKTLQINIGKLCNQTCAHCHVDAGPDKREENMSKETLEKCVDIIASTPTIETIDITGGAPEMNAHFRWFVETCRKLNKQVINRCNLTIIKANPKYHDLPDFFAKNQVHIISSLPYFSKSRTDSQRGDGVFEDSIEALKMLNEVGYGKEGSPLKLDLVFNPSGAFLPGDQKTLEAEFKRQLKRKYDLTFNSLFAITNLPIARFLDYLIASGNYEEYMQKLVNAFNPSTIAHLMCKNTVSVSWDGFLYDCDFNQMLDLKVSSSVKHLDEWDGKNLNNRTIVLNQHCYGCTAGAGSSCGGTVVS